MAFPLSGFHGSRLIRSSGQARVYEAIRSADGRSIVAKVFELGPGDVEDRVEHEFALLERLDVEGVVRAIGLQRIGDQAVLLLERAPGIDLAAHLDGRPMDLDMFMDLAVQIAAILERVHGRRVIHRDIKPANILIDSATGRVHLADFGISVLLESERRHIYDPAVLEGTLPYLSPEQTGRIARPVDFRSDLYSLGVSFYEALTGRRPFVYTTPLELIHAHLARIPESPRVHRPGLPDGVARVVLKLLAKAPEHRYQTAAGLGADLRALDDRLARGDEGEDFELGREDFPRTLQLPHQLYGRTQPRSDLSDEHAEVMREGRARVVLLAGPAGIGKSALITEFQGDLTRFGSYVARGRFDPNRERPYSAFVDALAGLTEQLLTENEHRLAGWRAALAESLGGIGRVITELVPNLELILGEQPELAPLDPREARNRIQLGAARFLAVFCADERPLVLVLEDLQWADHSSLSLLAALVGAESRTGAMLVVASYRDDEIGEQHPVHELLAVLPEHRRRTITLAPLDQSAVEALLVDTFARPAAEVRALTELVARKTNNNPLFISRLLSHLAATELLRPSDRGWTWDDAALEAAGIPDDVLEVMHAKLATLPEDARALLERAACIGDRFELAALELVCERGRAELSATLYALVEAGLLSRVGGGYGFTHHDIRELALASAGPELRRRLRWTIGRHLLATLELDNNERLFEVVDHLDAGLPAAGVLDDQTRQTLAEHNLRAGRRALASAAYDPALRYFECGIELLASAREDVAARGVRAPEYTLVVELHLARAVVLSVRAGRTQTEQAFTQLLGWRLATQDFGRVAGRRISALILGGHSDQALAFGLEALRRTKLRPTPTPTPARARANLRKALHGIEAVDLEALLALPDCTDAHADAAMEILAALRTAAYLRDPNLYVVLLSAHVRHVLRHGMHRSAAAAIANFAISVGSVLAEFEGALALAQRAWALAERSGSASTRIQVEATTQLFVAHLGDPFAAIIPRIEAVFPRALEAGDFLWAGYAGGMSLSMRFETGTHLQVLRRLAERFDRDAGARASGEVIAVASSFRALACVLGEAPEDPAVLEQAWASLDPDAFARRNASAYTIHNIAANRGLALLLLGDPAAALRDCLAILPTLERAMFASWMMVRPALTILVALHMLAPAERPANAERAAKQALGIIAWWARSASGNYDHYLDLGEGLRLVAAGRRREAIASIERARARASARCCRWIEGIAAETLAQLAEDDGLSGFASGARAQAASAYADWGAVAKRALRHETETHEPELGSERGSSTPSPGGHRGALDFDSVLRSVAAIGADLRLDQVIANVLSAAVVNAGADHGVLVLEREGELGVVATAELDGECRVFAQPLALAEARETAPTSLIRFVLRTGQALVLDDARVDLRFADDPYVRRFGSQSLLVMPVRHGRRTLGALTLENRLSRACFTPARLEVLQLIAGQAASSLEHTRVHAALREGEARWRSLVDGAPDVIALIDSERQVEFINRRGRQGVHTSGGHLLDAFARSSAGSDWAAAIEAVLGQGFAQELELELPREVGPSRWYVARLAPIELTHDNGEGPRPSPRKAIMIATDISARKQAELEHRQFEAQLRQQQRLESIGTLASGVAHEINNPIQGIMNYAELIAGNTDDREIVAEFAVEITRESERVAAIVRNLLSFSRQEGLWPILEADPRVLIDATLSLIRSVIRKDHIDLRIEVGPDVPHVRCQSQQIQQIIMNLVTNARDALNSVYPGYDERKWIVIRVERRASPTGPDVLRLTVEDNGPGIPPDVLPRIFDPFFTTKRSDQGTGLGLAVSHGIALDHGGDLSVDSRPGEGARFHLDLPLAASDEP